MHSLPLFLKLNGRKVVIVGDGEAADAKARLVERAGGIVVGEAHREGTTIAFVALDTESQAQAAAERLKGAGLLVNVVDRPDLCDFTTPAIVDRDPVLIAVATGGASAGLAKALRQRIEAMLPAGTGALASALRDARAAIKARWPGAAERRRALDDALSPGARLDPLVDSVIPAAERVTQWLSKGEAKQSARIETVDLISHSADDLTLRAARLLGEADHVVHPPDCPPALLVRARADATRHPASCDPSSLDGLVVVLKGPGRT